MTLLNIAEICPATRTLGPGQRFVIWVQGCCFNCRGCISPDWIPQKQATLVDPVLLANYILSIPGMEGRDLIPNLRNKTSFLAIKC